MARRLNLGIAAAGVCLLGAVACSDEVPTQPQAEETTVPEELAGEDEIVQPEGQVEGATPMGERTATIGVLNKRNNLSRDLEMQPGETRRLGNIAVRLSACERTAPWESPQETGAFVQVLVRDANQQSGEGEFRRIFSGWLFKNSPSLNVVEHPIYDVWVKDCAMSFPGEEA
ncbi:DUF2155 domain-containing protein [Qipengyuania atrilutea]|uniref:DUF2155 domain-containing protein n=1 Tax=Qipengyuania atrilutea TaxID=2744473 RepID=A0A850H8E0_9SPHN|nr:DUF2155 domain-containing protein [Actirhodobacter atriluteus]NVD45515.1 DUF2155 domain-containing protein [Actirhodobacter atriluteus]